MTESLHDRLNADTAAVEISEREAPPSRPAGNTDEAQPKPSSEKLLGDAPESDARDGDARDDAHGDEVVSRAFRWSLVGFTLIGLVSLIVYLVSAPVKVGELEPDLRLPYAEVPQVKLAPEQVPDLPFTEITREAGLDFVHFSGAAGKMYMPETMGSGCAFFDYDNDDRQDILLLNGWHFPGLEPTGPPAKAAPRTMALYHNEGQGRFRDVTVGSGLDVSFYGVGVAVGDYDGDGLTDLFVAALGPNRLFRNLGSGRFREVTPEAGVAGEPNRWSTSAGFLDYDNDGDLDLFVGNYVDWSAEQDEKLEHALLGVPNYVAPWQFRGTHSYLYRNRGDGTFEDVSRTAGIQVESSLSGQPRGKALGVVVCDLDEDGWQDMVVANDGVPAFLFHNARNGTFHEVGEAAGIARDALGFSIDGMGIDMAHLHGDSRITLGLANTDAKTEALFVSQGNPFRYLDEVLNSGIAADSQRYTSWGLFFFDCDLDGRLDMFECNGQVHSQHTENLIIAPFLQPSQLFWNCGPNRQGILLSPLPVEKRSPALEQPLLARGAAYADIDGDGDLDLLLSQIDRPAVLLRNDQRLGHNWIRLKLSGDGRNREAIGARIEVRVGGQPLRRRVQPTRSYLSQVELPVTVGLGKHAAPDEVRVIWPDGTIQAVSDVKVNALTTVQKVAAKSGK